MPITNITGPFCNTLFGTYIAHETDTAEFNVSIIMEDGVNVILPENAPTGGAAAECQIEQICCVEPAYFLFVDETETEIIYGPVLQERFGAAPTVNLFYFDTDAEEGGLISSGGVYTQIAFDGDPLTKITVRHGGPATGVIKLS